LGRLGIGKLLVGLGRLDFIRKVMVGQDRVRLDRIRLGRVGLDWVGLGWVGLGWIGVDWVGVDYKFLGSNGHSNEMWIDQ